MAYKYKCYETADCGEYRDIPDPGRTSCSGDENVRWQQCVDCGECYPISTQTGRMLSVAFYPGFRNPSPPKP